MIVVLRIVSPQHLLLRSAALLSFVSASVAAQSIVYPNPSSNVETSLRCDPSGPCEGIIAKISFPEQGLSGQLTIDFSGASNLSADSLLIQAGLIEPNDPLLIQRLPKGTFVPQGFPVLITINVAKGTSFSYRSRYSLELITKNLEYTPETPFRLFRAPNGGAFRDVSSGLGSGSLRVFGTGGSFSELLLLADLRPLTAIVEDKLSRVAEILDASASQIDQVLDELSGLVVLANQAFDDGDDTTAILRVRQLLAEIEDNEGTNIPDTSYPGASQASVAGRLRAAVETLLHSLVLDRRAKDEGGSSIQRTYRPGPNLSVDLKLTFDEAFEIDPDALQVETEILDDAQDPDLLARLPAGVQVPSAFPVLLRIRPRTGLDQAFSGRYTVELHTEDLSFVGNSPLRLFKAPEGGMFEDITQSLGLGSLRVFGTGGSFSELLIVRDLRSTEDAITAKLSRLEQLLESRGSQIPSSLEQQLADLLAEVRRLSEQGAPSQAMATLQQLLQMIRDNRGESIPSVWRPSQPGGNLAGELLSIGESLHFSLELSATPPETEPGDVNRDGKVDITDLLQLIDRVFGEP